MLTRWFPILWYKCTKGNNVKVTVSHSTWNGKMCGQSREGHLVHAPSNIRTGVALATHSWAVKAMEKLQVWEDKRENTEIRFPKQKYRMVETRGSKPVGLPCAGANLAKIVCKTSSTPREPTWMTGRIPSPPVSVPNYSSHFTYSENSLGFHLTNNCLVICDQPVRREDILLCSFQKEKINQRTSYKVLRSKASFTFYGA